MSDITVIVQESAPIEAVIQQAAPINVSVQGESPVTVGVYEPAPINVSAIEELISVVEVGIPGPPGPQGLQGPAGVPGGTEGMVQRELAFTYADDGAVVPQPDNAARIIEAEIEITTIFNGGNPTISVGTDADHDALIGVDENQPKRAATFESELNMDWSGDPIKVWITPDGATAGSGKVRVMYVTS